MSELWIFQIKIRDYADRQLKYVVEAPSAEEAFNRLAGRYEPGKFPWDPPIIELVVSPAFASKDVIRFGEGNGKVSTDR